MEKREFDEEIKFLQAVIEGQALAVDKVDGITNNLREMIEMANKVNLANCKEWRTSQVLENTEKLLLKENEKSQSLKDLQTLRKTIVKVKGDYFNALHFYTRPGGADKADFLGDARSRAEFKECLSLAIISLEDALKRVDKKLKDLGRPNDKANGKHIVDILNDMKTLDDKKESLLRFFTFTVWDNIVFDDPLMREVAQPERHLYIRSKEKIAIKEGEVHDLLFNLHKHLSETYNLNNVVIAEIIAGTFTEGNELINFFTTKKKLSQLNSLNPKPIPWEKD